MHFDIPNFNNMGGRHYIYERPGSDIKKVGYLKKLKTNRKKYFVLRSTSSSGPARLEYYDHEKKFQSGQLPKRSIHLHTCFNINKKSDSRHGKFGIVLYSSQDAFAVLAESEDEQEAWLEIMREFQNEYLPDGNIRREHFDHVWQVTMQPRGLGQAKGIKGQYRFCLNSINVALFKASFDQAQFIIQLVTIRTVAHHENIFWMDVGNYSSTGPGEFWFSLEDVDSAKNIHTTLLQYMNSVHDPNLSKDQHIYARKDIHFRDSRWDPMNMFKDVSPSSSPHDLDGEINCSYPDMPIVSYPPSLNHHGLPASHPIAIHGFSESLHPSHLPTVREGGSTEGYFPMEVSDSQTSLSNFPRPEPATCLLSDDSSDLPPRTYSLGSKPIKKYHGYPDNDLRKGMGNDMSRALSAPHILKGRRDHTNSMITPGPSPLSVSLKSDDSDSFVECTFMRPRTSSDSFNYRSRTSSFGKQPQQMFRPRSSSHGQGKRPVININKLNAERARLSQDPMLRASRESSLQGSSDSLYVSSENLRKTSLEMRQQNGSGGGDYPDMRKTPSPQMKRIMGESDCYNDIHVGNGERRSSPHRPRTDSNGSAQYRDCKNTSSEGLQKYNSSDKSAGGTANMEPSAVSPHHNESNENKSLPPQMQTKSCQEDSRYVNVDFNNKSKKRDQIRAMSVENVDTYIIYDVNQSGDKARAGSVGSKDKKNLRSGLGKRLSSLVSSSQPSSGVINQQTHPLISASACIGGSIDSIRKASRQPSTEKFAALGKDFRMKSGSIGSRPTNTSTFFGPAAVGKEQLVSGTDIIHMRKSSVVKVPADEESDEYVEFPSTATKCDNSHAQPSCCAQSSTNPTRAGNSSTSAHKPGSPPAEQDVYIMYNPATPSPAKSQQHQQPFVPTAHTHHHNLQSRSSHLSASSSQIKHVLASEQQEYIGFEPGLPTGSSYSKSSNNSKYAEPKDEYVEYKPPTGPLSNNALFQPAIPKLTSPRDAEEYVAYNPVTISQCLQNKPLAPSSAVSYIQSMGNNGIPEQAKLKHRGLKQMSLDAANCMSRPTPHMACMTRRKLSSGSLTLDPHPEVEGDTPSSWIPPVPPLSLSSTNQQPQNESDYLNFHPGLPIVANTSQGNGGGTNSRTSISNQQTKPFKETSNDPYVSFPQHKYAEIRTSQQDQMNQLKKQSLHTQNFQRQLSAPACQSPQLAQDLQTSPQNMSPMNSYSHNIRHSNNSPTSSRPTPLRTDSSEKKNMETQKPFNTADNDELISNETNPSQIKSTEVRANSPKSKNQNIVNITSITQPDNSHSKNTINMDRESKQAAFSCVGSENPHFTKEGSSGHFSPNNSSIPISGLSSLDCKSIATQIQQQACDVTLDLSHVREHAGVNVSYSHAISSDVGQTHSSLTPAETSIVQVS